MENSLSRAGEQLLYVQHNSSRFGFSVKRGIYIGFIYNDKVGFFLKFFFWV